METLTVNKSNLVRHLLKLHLRQRAQNALRATESSSQSVAHLPGPGESCWEKRRYKSAPCFQISTAV